MCVECCEQSGCGIRRAAARSNPVTREIPESREYRTAAPPFLNTNVVIIDEVVQLVRLTDQLCRLTRARECPGVQHFPLV